MFLCSLIALHIKTRPYLEYCFVCQTLQNDDISQRYHYPFSHFSDLPWLTIALSLVGKYAAKGMFDSLYITTGELFPTLLRYVLSNAEWWRFEWSNRSRNVIRYVKNKSGIYSQLSLSIDVKVVYTFVDFSIYMYNSKHLLPGLLVDSADYRGVIICIVIPHPILRVI